ncbi:MAG: hypothetical protein KDC44_16680, partial [Phaeodactylibacter sp.]|nr:hypothetical protein [Phaeodactylibacter sp.]
MPEKSPWYKTSVLAVCLAFCHVVAGQSFPFCSADYKALTKADGLSGENYNNFVYQDQFGFVWISSLEGLNRFDGIAVRNYVEIPDDSTSMLGQNIQSNFYETPAGDLWFSTYVALNRYIRTSDRFERVQLEVNGNLIDKDYRVFHREGSSGQLWMRADTHLLVFDPVSRTQELLPCKSQAITFGVATDAVQKPNRIIGAFWGERGFEYHYRNAEGVWDLIEYREDWVPRGAEENLVYKRVLVQDSSTFWLLASGGLLQFNAEHPECSNFYPAPKGLRLGGGVRLQENLVLNTNRGFQSFNLRSYRYLPGQCEPLALEEHALAQEIYDLSGTGHLWIRLKGKGLRYIARPLNQGFSAVDFKLPAGRQPVVEHLAQDSMGRLWVGTRNQGVFLLSDAGELLKHYRLSEQVGDKINHLTIDRQGTVWVLGEHHVLNYDPALDAFQVVTEEGITSRLIALHQLPSGRKLVATSLGLFDLRQRGSAYELIRAPEFEAYQELSFLRSFLSSDGSFWLSYSSKELWRCRQGPDGQVQ